MIDGKNGLDSTEATNTVAHSLKDCYADCISRSSHNDDYNSKERTYFSFASDSTTGKENSCACFFEYKGCEKGSDTELDIYQILHRVDGAESKYQI